MRHIYPSVTEVLDRWVNWDAVPKKVLEAAKARGDAVHSICASFAKYGMAVNVPAQYAGYVNSFRDLFSRFEQVITVEKRIFNDALRLTGRPDLVVVMTGERLPRVLDLKTPASVYRTWRTQLAAYKLLWEHDRQLPTDAPAYVRLKEDGSPAVVTIVEDWADETVRFMSALTLYHHYVS